MSAPVTRFFAVGWSYCGKYCFTYAPTRSDDYPRMEAARRGAVSLSTLANAPFEPKVFTRATSRQVPVGRLPAEAFLRDVIPLLDSTFLLLSQQALSVLGDLLADLGEITPLTRLDRWLFRAHLGGLCLHEQSSVLRLATGLPVTKRQTLVLASPGAVPPAAARLPHDIEDLFVSDNFLQAQERGALRGLRDDQLTEVPYRQDGACLDLSR